MSVIPAFRTNTFLAVPSPLVRQVQPAPAQDLHLRLELPEQEYKTRKTVAVPFDSRLTNGLFETLTEAMIFIAKHCQFHHQQFNRNLARMYLKQCLVLNLVKGGFVRPTHVTKRDFDSAFHQAMKAVGN